MKIAIDISYLHKVKKLMTSDEVIVEVSGMPAAVPFRQLPSTPILGCAPRKE